MFKVSLLSVGRIICPGIQQLRVPAPITPWTSESHLVTTAVQNTCVGVKHYVQSPVDPVPSVSDPMVVSFFLIPAHHGTSLTIALMQIKSVI
jgi:hypothetical protein